jgi:hypothetical protein
MAPSAILLVECVGSQPKNTRVDRPQLIKAKPIQSDFVVVVTCNPIIIYLTYLWLRKSAKPEGGVWAF